MTSKRFVKLNKAALHGLSYLAGELVAYVDVLSLIFVKVFRRILWETMKEFAE